MNNPTKIYYDPYSQHGSGIADRRRILHWAKCRNVEIVLVDEGITPPDNSTIVITSSSNLSRWAEYRKRNSGSTVILDIVDGVQGEESKLKDLLRGLSLVLAGRIDGKPYSMARILRNSVPFLDSIICSSVEQAQSWRHFFTGEIHIALDFHSEFPELTNDFALTKYEGVNLFWEGLPYTLSHFSSVSEFMKGIVHLKPRLNILTSFESRRYLGKYVTIDPLQELRKVFNFNNVEVQIKEWSLSSVAETAQYCSLGIIPMTLGRGYDFLKAENRLLIMWRLGLPVLTGPLPAYLRVEKLLGFPFVCKSTDDWIRNFYRLHGDIDYRKSFQAATKTYLANFHTEQILLRKWDKVFCKITG